VNKAIALVLLLAACTAQPAATNPDAAELSNVNPVGTWALTLVWGTGTCNLTGSSSYAPALTDLVQWVTGTLATGVVHALACSPNGCAITVVETYSGTGLSEATTYDLSLDVQKGIRGTGIENQLQGSVSCTQNLSVSGTLVP
jgi:hypothetical protein